MPDSPPAPANPSLLPSRRRRWLPLVFVLAAAAGIAGALFLINRAPDYLAQYLVRTYLQGLDIDTAGVETIDVDPVAGAVTFGPVTFRGAGAATGQIGSLGIKVSLRRLLQRQALLQAVVIEGVRIELRQSADGAFHINGIPLAQLLPPATTGNGEGKSGPTDEPRSPWATGLNALQIQDSRLAFADRRGGQAELHIETLELNNFVSWAPNDPGHFRLKGDLNGISIAMTGIATPFAQTLAIDAKLDVSGIEVSKIETYTGPLGMTAAAGRLDVELQTTGSVLFPEGRVDGRLQGQVRLTGVDVAHPQAGSIRLPAATATFGALRLLYDTSETVTLSGDGAIDLDTLALRFTDGSEVAIGNGRLVLAKLDARLSPDGVASLTIEPALDAQALTLGGPHVRGAIGSTTIRLSSLALDPGAAGPAFSATGTVKVSALALLLPLKKPISINVGEADIALAQTAFAFLPDRTGINGLIDLDATTVAVAINRAVPPGERPPSIVTVGADQVQGRFPAFLLDERSDGVTIALPSPKLALARFALTSPVSPRQTLQLAASSLKLAPVEASIRDAETLQVAASCDLKAPDFTITLIDPEGRSPDTSVALNGLHLEPRRFTYQEEGPLASIGYQGALAVASTHVQLPARSGEAAVATLDGLRLVADEIGMQIDTPAPIWQAQRFDIAVRTIGAMIPGALTTNVDVRDVALTDASLSSRPEYAFEQFAVGRFDVALTRDATVEPSLTTDDAPPRPVRPATRLSPDARQRPWPPPDLPLVRFRRMGLRDAGRIRLIDRTVVPPATSTISVESLAVTDVDTTRPEARSDLRVKARLDQADLTIDGWGRPFLSKPSFDLQGRLSDLVLSSLNPYLGPKIGLDVIRGRLSAGAGGEADAGRLRGEIGATVTDLAFADRPEAGTDQVSRSIGVPLSTIIRLLQDADGTITFTLPFEGDLLSPEFDYSDVLWEGFLRVLRALVTAPLQLISASVALVSAADADAASQREPSAGSSVPRPPPIVFAPATADLNAEARATVEALRRLLESRPMLHIHLCGAATAADQRMLDAQPRRTTGAALPIATAAAPSPDLQVLAFERMRSIEQALLEGARLAADRVHLCEQPGANVADERPPRVEIRF